MMDNLSEIIILSSATIEEAIKKIDLNGKRGVFICEEDKNLVGIIMDSDIRRLSLKNINLQTSVKTIMKTTPFCIPEDISLKKKKQMLIDSDKVLAPIVNKHGCVVDYLWLDDILEDFRIFTKESIDNRILPSQKVLVIGGAGYIGSVLVDKLIRRGYVVRVLDILLYGKDSLQIMQNSNVEFIRGDCRDSDVIKQVLEGIDAVIHLGEIVGDPACDINESFTIETNFSATNMILEQCLKKNVKRLIFASSCSVYGQNNITVVEESTLNPVSLYARCKIESEKVILSYRCEHFCPTILRLATVHGRSFRQRFDLIVNLLTIKAIAEKKIQIFGGEQWRPFISVQDVCLGILSVLQANSVKVENKIFNLGDSRQNFQISQIASFIKRQVLDVEIENPDKISDNRNYNVSFDKIKQELGFTTEFTIEDTIEELTKAYSRDKLFQDYNDPKYYNVRSLK